MDVLEQAGEAVCKWDTQRPQQIVPVWLHVLAGSALGVTLTARILVVGCHDVRDEVVVTTGSLEGENKILILSQKMQKTQTSNKRMNPCKRDKCANW